MPPSPSPRTRIHIHPLKRWSLIFLVLLLLSGILNNWPLALPQALAAMLQPPPQAKLNFQQFLKQGSRDTKHSSAPLVRPQKLPQVPSSKQAPPAQKPLPSAEPVKMKPLAYQLDGSFLLNASPANLPNGQQTTTLSPAGTPAATIPAGTAPLTAVGSDGRFEVALPRGSMDLAGATLDTGKAPVGALTLQIIQQQGHFVEASSILGTYLIQVVDSQGHAVHGIYLRQPVTIRYHYQPTEMANLNLNPDRITLSWLDPQKAARTSASSSTGKQSPTGMAVPFTNDAKTHTLTAQLTTLGTGALAASGPPEIQAPPSLSLNSLQGNSGQMTYSYPISVAPGPDGFAPQLNLSYSSETTNGRTSRRSPASDVGDGWSLSLSSITMATYPSSSTSAGSWYFLSGVDGVSDRLVPDTSRSGGFYVTEHLSYLRIQLSNNCWRIWDRSGTYYELGCTPDSQQYTTSGGVQTTYRWNLSKVFAPYNSVNQVKAMFLTYISDTVFPDGPTIRDSVLKQITYGYLTSNTHTSLDQVMGTVDFHYHGPSEQDPWETAYGTNYNCASTPPKNTTWRCDDPQDFGSTSAGWAPAVMSVFSLDSVTSYVGRDDGTGSPAYHYDFTYQDTPFTDQYWDAFTQVQLYAAGEHLLTSVTHPPFSRTGRPFHARACNSAIRVHCRIRIMIARSKIWPERRK